MEDKANCKLKRINLDHVFFFSLLYQFCVIILQIYIIILSDMMRIKSSAVTISYLCLRESDSAC